MIGLAIFKGVLMAAVVLAVAELPFLQALLVAACSATITGLFLVVASYVQARHTGREVKEAAQDVKRTVTATAAGEGPEPGVEPDP